MYSCGLCVPSSCICYFTVTLSSWGYSTSLQSALPCLESSPQFKCTFKSRAKACRGSSGIFQQLSPEVKQNALYLTERCISFSLFLLPKSKHWHFCSTFIDHQPLSLSHSHTHAHTHSWDYYSVSPPHTFPLFLQSLPLFLTVLLLGAFPTHTLSLLVLQDGRQRLRLTLHDQIQHQPTVGKVRHWDRQPTHL